MSRTSILNKYFQNSWRNISRIVSLFQIFNGRFRLIMEKIRKSRNFSIKRQIELMTHFRDTIDYISAIIRSAVSIVISCHTSGNKKTRVSQSLAMIATALFRKRWKYSILEPLWLRLTNKLALICKDSKSWIIIWRVYHHQQW